jgi:Late exocytosis, associated with Golgi transport/Calcium-dependent channel, 7TM region, putative phosphate/Cytosolic domain of 10TM putative phosphate transporter
MRFMPRTTDTSIFLQNVRFLCLFIFIYIFEAGAAEVNGTVAPSFAPTTAALQEAQTWAVLRTSLIIYLPSFVVILLLFCYVRLKFPAVYNVRNTVEKIRNPLAASQHGFYGWMWNIMFISEDQMFDTCGMDALCMLRVTRMGTYLSFVGVLCSIFLIPTYVFAPTTAASPDGWVQTTSSNLTEGSTSYTSTVFAAYIIFGLTMYLISKDFQWFISARETFLSLRVARSYSVYVAGIPKTHRSNDALAQFFRRVISEDAVFSACVAMHLPKLTIAVNKQSAIKQNVEKVSILYSLNPDKEPMHISLHPKKKEVIERIPAIPYYNQQLNEVNEEICELQTIILTRQQLSNSGHYNSNNSQSDTQNEKMKEFNKFQSEMVVSSTSIAIGCIEGACEDVGTSGINSRLVSEPFKETDLDECTDSGGKSDQVAFSLQNSNPEHKNDENSEAGLTVNAASKFAPSFHGLQYAATLSEHLSEAGTRGITKIVSTIASAIGHIGDEGKPLNVGFVTFKKLSAVAVAVQTVHSTVPFEMGVVEAPSPEQVLWNNIGLTNRSLQLRRLISFVVTGLLCIFWTVPVTLLVSLTEVQVLQEKIPFLEGWLEAAPWLEGLLSQISPLLLSFLNSVVVPMLLRLISTYEGVIGLSHLEASLFTKLASFSVRCAHVQLLLLLYNLLTCIDLITCFNAACTNILCRLHCWKCHLGFS